MLLYKYSSLKGFKSFQRFFTEFMVTLKIIKMLVIKSFSKAFGFLFKSIALIAFFLLPVSLIFFCSGLVYAASEDWTLTVISGIVGLLLLIFNND